MYCVMRASVPSVYYVMICTALVKFQCIFRVSCGLADLKQRRRSYYDSQLWCPEAVINTLMTDDGKHDFTM